MKYNFRENRKYSVLLLFISLLMPLSITEEARAQMFSVEENEPVRERSLIPPNAVYLGLEPVEFTYRGDVSNANSGAYAFDGPLLRMRFETYGFEAYIGVGGRLTGIDDIGYFDAGAKAVRGLRLVRQPGFQFQIPLQIKSSINTVTNNQGVAGDAQFRQGTLEFGAGAQVNARLGQQVRISAAAIPNYGFSFATGGIFGGQIYELETKSRLYVDRVFGDVGITAGWDYGFKRFDVEENEFDYNLRSYSFIIGITF
ncbi:hypothetical protein ACG2F4_18720 [Halalkalibaculum sp. DA3122]|uniref:hypothetical protein n=1 Tax=Halalkalibaculum sp. DA3122 TaxID=3373607 RepID=UPI00375496D6